MNKLTITLLLGIIFLNTGCFSKKSKDQDNQQNDDSICEVLNGSTQCGTEGQNDDPQPTDPGNDDGNQDTPVDDPITNENFEVTNSYPADLESEFHVDDTITITFSQNVDTSNITINSGTNLDIISLKDENDQNVYIDISWNNNILYLKPRHSLIPNHEYNLTILNELRDTRGEYLYGNYYLRLYTEGEPLNPGTNIELSWDYSQQNDDNGYNQYTLGFDVKSRFDDNGGIVRDYDHKENFDVYHPNFYHDMDLNRNFYNTNLNLLKSTEYYFSLKVCHEYQTHICSEYSNEVPVTPSTNKN